MTTFLCRCTFLWCQFSVLAAIALCTSVVHADGVREPTDDIDYLSLASRLMSDGHLERAREALRSVDVEHPNLDRHRYHLLQGLVALRKQAYADAAQALEMAINIPPATSESDGDNLRKVDPQLHYSLAQAHFGLKQYNAALSDLDAGGHALNRIEGAHQLRAESHYALRHFSAAMDALMRAKEAFPEVAQFQRMHVFYLMELGLYQDATELGRTYLRRRDVTALDYVAIGEALRRSSRYGLAAEILETAHLRFPQDTKIMLALAHVHVDIQQPLSAAMILEGAARVEPEYTVEAAEMYRLAKRTDRALLLNARVEDQRKKFKQRLSILLDQQRFELVATMAATLQRLDLMNDDQIRYAVAYGYFKIGDHRSSEKALRGISDTSLLESTNGLRRAMRACAPTNWECL